MYHPLLIHERLTGSILGTFLRPGNAHCAENVISALRPIVTHLQQAFPHALVLLRADSGFATPRLYQLCEAHGIGFTIAVPANQVLKRRSDQLQLQAAEQYEATCTRAKRYDHFFHQANSWPHHRRVLTKVEAGPQGLNRRFVVTNRPGAAQHLFDFYEARGRPKTISKSSKTN